MPGTQFARSQFLDARRVHAHAVAHLPHQFQAAQQALHGFLLLLHLPLPMRARGGKCQQAGLLHLRALQARCLRLDQVFQPVLNALDLLVLGLDLRRQCRAILGVQRGGIQHCRLLQLLVRCLVELRVSLHLGAAPRACASSPALLRPLHR